MRKIDHVRKTIYIIVGILTIISLVFSLYKKISHAASSDESPISYNPPPFLVSSGVGSYDSYDRSTILGIVDNSLSNHPLSDDEFFMVLPYRNELWCVYVSGNAYDISSDIFWLQYSYLRAYSSAGVFNSNYTNGRISVDTLSIRETINGVDYYKSTAAGLNYPVYIRNEEFCTYNGEQCFTEEIVPVGPQGHTKGGVLSNYLDSEDLLENSSDVPKVDTTPPSDPSNNSGWFQKILNGIGKLNQSIQGGILTIGDYIGQIGDSIGQKIDGIYSWFTEDFDKNEFQSGLNSIPLISDLNGLHTLVNNSGMFNWSDVSPAQTVSFTFDFGGAVLPHTSTTIDFSWYSGTIKNICVALICTFLVLGLLVTIINQLPGIIGGHSGDKGGGSDS